MKGYIHYNNSESEVEAEFHSCPVSPEPPMSDERFSQLVRLAEIGVVAAANVGCTYLLGIPGLLFS